MHATATRLDTTRMGLRFDHRGRTPPSTATGPLPTSSAIMPRVALRAPAVSGWQIDRGGYETGDQAGARSATIVYSLSVWECSAEAIRCRVPVRGAMDEVANGAGRALARA